MVLGVTELDVAISERLKPVRETLADCGITVASLPKEVGKYLTDEDIGAIIITIPKVSNVSGDDIVDGFQDVLQTINIRITLPKRYTDDPTEKDVLEWCASQITGLLIGFKPDISRVKRPIRFEDYQLLTPDKGNWSCDLTFNLLKTISSLDYVEPNYPEQLLPLQLFASQKELIESDSVLTS